MSYLCASVLSGCFSAKEETSRNRASHHGVEREMKILYQQPHLVEPMKLRVYEDLPSTPLPVISSGLPQWQLFPSRNTASRPSSRASHFSLRKKTPRPSISKPVPVLNSANDLPFRRRQQYRPLELSIYVEEEERLSDLPEFDRLSFTEAGVLKLPPKALVHTLSEQIPQTDVAGCPINQKSDSMFGVEHTSPTRPTTSYSIVSTSRPPSEYEALHSHPVSWSGLLGFANSTRKVDSSVDILTPMQEEFSPGIVELTSNGAGLVSSEKHPKAIVTVVEVKTRSKEIAMSAILVNLEPLHSIKTTAQSNDKSVPPYFHTNYQTQKRISQWLAYRTHSGSTSTVGSASTTTSFADHRRKRSEFYQLGKQPPTASASPPQPLQLVHTNSPHPQHQRTVTVSTTGSSVGTEVLSFGFTARASEDSMTTFSAADLMSRQGTIKSVASPGGHRVTMARVQDLGLTLPLHCEAAVVEEEMPYLEEIGGPLRSPGVGIAF